MQVQIHAHERCRGRFAVEVIYYAPPAHKARPRARHALWGGRKIPCSNSANTLGMLSRAVPPDVVNSSDSVSETKATARSQRAENSLVGFSDTKRYAGQIIAYSCLSDRRFSRENQWSDWTGLRNSKAIPQIDRDLIKSERDNIKELSPLFPSRKQLKTFWSKNHAHIRTILHETGFMEG